MKIEIAETAKPGWNLDNSYTSLPGTFFTHIQPSPVRAPKLVIFNESLAAFLGLDVGALQSDEGVEILAGNRAPRSAIPLAQAYAGHQYGHFTMLGDGRALLIGEQITPSGKRFDIQLKGSGRTPYSRGGDGRAVLGPMLREYIISEAMDALGIETTRSLAVATTGEFVLRENDSTGAILTRVASSHLRVGTFQYASKWGTIEDLRALADYTLNRHFIQGGLSDELYDLPGYEQGTNRYLYLLKAVVRRQAQLIAKWQLVGFIHGVMNTDNMALSGETIDYGPCAFMNHYDPETVFSSIDRFGRYAYGHQPEIAAWNLARFAEALLPLLHEDQDKSAQLAKDAVGEFHSQYHYSYLKGMRAKLGIMNEEPEDEVLIQELLGMMQKYRTDYTNTFRALTYDKPLNSANSCKSQTNQVDSTLFQSLEFESWYKRWQERLDRQQESKISSDQTMKKSNPVVIPRNHRVEEALEAAVKHGDLSVMKKLLNVLLTPFQYTPQQDEYIAPPMQSAKPYRTFCGT